MRNNVSFRVLIKLYEIHFSKILILIVFFFGQVHLEMLSHCFQESKATAKYQTSGPDLPCPGLTFERIPEGFELHFYHFSFPFTCLSATLLAIERRELINQGEEAPSRIRRFECLRCKAAKSPPPASPPLVAIPLHVSGQTNSSQSHHKRIC